MKWSLEFALLYDANDAMTFMSKSSMPVLLGVLLHHCVRGFPIERNVVHLWSFTVGFER